MVKLKEEGRMDETDRGREGTKKRERESNRKNSTGLKYLYIYIAKVSNTRLVPYCI